MGRASLVGALVICAVLLCIGFWWAVPNLGAVGWIWMVVVGAIGVVNTLAYIRSRAR